MRLATLLISATFMVGCGKEKRDAGVADSFAVSTGAIDTPPDTNSLRETPGTLPMPTGVTPGVTRAPLQSPYPPQTYPAERTPAYTPPPPAAVLEPAPAPRTPEATRTTETVRRFDPPPESLKVAPAQPKRDSTAERRREPIPAPARDTNPPRRDTIPL